jgi:hypothetical protein
MFFQPSKNESVLFSTICGGKKKLIPASQLIYKQMGVYHHNTHPHPTAKLPSEKCHQGSLSILCRSLSLGKL